MKMFEITFIDHLNRRWKATTQALNASEAMVELVNTTKYAVSIFSFKVVGNG